MSLDAGQPFFFQLRQHLFEQLRAGGRDLPVEVCQCKWANLSQRGLP